MLASLIGGFIGLFGYFWYQFHELKRLRMFSWKDLAWKSEAALEKK